VGLVLTNRYISGYNSSMSKFKDTWLEKNTVHVTYDKNGVPISSYVDEEAEKTYTPATDEEVSKLPVCPKCGAKVTNMALHNQENHKADSKKSFKDTWKAKAVSTADAGPVPNSLLADQDLEGEKCPPEDYELSDEVNRKAGEYSRVGKNATYGPAEDKKIMDLHRQGMNARDIAERLGLETDEDYDEATVQRVLDQNKTKSVVGNLKDLKDDAKDADTKKEKAEIKSDIISEQKKGLKDTIKERMGKSFKDFWKGEIVQKSVDDKDGAAVRNEAESLMRTDSRIWDKNGYSDGGDVKEDWKNYVKQVGEAVGRKVSKGAYDILEDQNHHSMCKALGELGKIKN
jgi:hypothetical protein